MARPQEKIGKSRIKSVSLAAFTHFEDDLLSVLTCPVSVKPMDYHTTHR